MKYICLIILHALLACEAMAQTSYFSNEASPKHEVRAVWLTTIGGIDWPHSHSVEAQKRELTVILDKLQQAGVNTVLLQTRVRGTTIYPSAVEPWDGCLTGQPGKSPGYDPLAFCIDECHRRGMECHAWVVTIPVGKWQKLGCLQLRKKHPKLIRHIGEDGYMDPEQPQTGDYIAAMCREIADNYDVDGIHLDYIRYPESWPKAKAKALPARRAYITDIVRKVNRAVKSVKPWVKLSCSPIGKHDNLTRFASGGWNARTAVAQDAQAWLREGLMDALFPMMYFQGDNFYPFAIDWQEQAAGRVVAPGLGIYFLDPREGKWSLPVIEREMHVLRQLGLGHAYFRSKFFTDNVKGVYDFASRFDQVPALFPPMTWATTSVPSAPTHIKIEGTLLSWDEAYDSSGAPYLLYNIYASDRYPVDTDDPRNLMAQRVTSTSMSVPEGYYYAVRAMNRFGIEGKPCQQDRDKAVVPRLTGADKMYYVADGKLCVPHEPTLDAKYIVVVSMQGNQIRAFPWTSSINVKAIPDGIYQLRSLGRKGRSHRLGFMYKRSKE